MCRGNDADININVAVTAERAHFALLQNTQQFDLQRHRHIPDFIEEQCAALCRLEQPFPAAHRAGKGTFGMAEQLGFQQLLRQCTTVDGDKRFFRSRAGFVDSLGQYLFPGTTLTVDQHTDVGLRHHTCLFQQTQHQRAAGHNPLTPGFITDRGGGKCQRIVNRFI